MRKNKQKLVDDIIEMGKKKSFDEKQLELIVGIVKESYEVGYQDFKLDVIDLIKAK